MIITSRLREMPQMAAEELKRAEAPVRCPRRSGGRTAALVAEGVRRVGQR